MKRYFLILLLVLLPLQFSWAIAGAFIGGVLSSTVLTLLLLPLMYYQVHRKTEKIKTA